MRSDDEMYEELVEYAEDYEVTPLEYLTPVPDKITVVELDPGIYYMEGLDEESSLFWIGIVQEVFKAETDEDWTVDDPGTLYIGFEEESVHSLDRLTEVAEVARQRYSKVYDRALAESVPKV